MLRHWLGEETYEEFLRSSFRKQPYAAPGVARDALSACSWEGLEAILGAEPPADTLVISRGQLAVEAAPRSVDALRALFARGIGIVVRHAQRQYAPLMRLTRRFAEDMPGEQRVLVFATPKGTHGFGWHYDAEEVFILQTAGEKTYYFRANTIDPEPVLGAQPDFSTIRNETTPKMACSLLAGDMLYLPRGYWHVAQPGNDSLSISIGVVPLNVKRAAPSA